MRRIVILACAVTLLVVFAVAQLVLPGIAAQQLRDRLARSGTVLNVTVDAFPAIKLLWHDADRVTVRLADYRASPSSLSSLLDQSGQAGTVDAAVGELQSGLLTLRDATLRKRGDTLSGTARVSEGDLRAAVPFLDAVSPVASGAGQLVLRGTATLLGVTASIDAIVAAQGGRLIVQPDVPFGGLATFTVFSDPKLEVETLAADAVSGGFTVSATGRLRG